MKKLFLVSIVISMALSTSACAGGVFSALGAEIDSVTKTVGNQKRIKGQANELEKIDKNICFIINGLVDVKNELESASKKKVRDDITQNLSQATEKIEKIDEMIEQEECMHSLTQARR